MRLPLLSLLLAALLLAACQTTSDEPRTLAVNVQGSVSVRPTSFSGYYIYEDSTGVEVRRSLNGSGSYNDIFSGRRILRVSLRRTSADGLIGLVLTSDGNEVFNSGILQTDEMILYEAEG
ncbi:MAG: hypothetical protein KJO55_01495 [Gammaproteobacteria bacterium]|nr:hypothetical protein [Gammaproteobacteria bacterium]NND60377.1 hypothetical protein [Gammaproteobacteria bacterium]